MIGSQFVPMFASPCVTPLLTMMINPQLFGRVVPICSVAGMLWWTQVGRSPTALAQIRPDTSLGDTPSTVRLDTSTEQQLIEGGAARGSALFHSFRTFNIESDGNAYFVNPDTIDLIVARVTGKRTSNLLGPLGVLGDADLFFINPNGIAFGPNSTLDINGSFIASTADSIVFGDEFAFSASTPDEPPLLTVTAPTGLRFGQQPGPIQYETPSASSVFGLRVQPNQTLAMLGGELDFQGANLQAVRGRIELGSVADAGLVEASPINKGWMFDYDSIQSFHNLTSASSFISTATSTFEDIATFNTESSNTTDSGGDIVIQAQDIDLSVSTIILANTFANVPAGNITINARRLTLDQSANIASRAIALTEASIRGRSGNIVINASESVTVTGARNTDSPGFTAFTAITADVIGDLPFGDGVFGGSVTGNGGNITINTRQLAVRDGATIITSTQSKGNAGSIIINASESVEVDGLFVSNTAPERSTISSESSGGTGDGGTIVINTGRLSLRDTGSLTAVSTGSGNGGSIEVNAETIELSGSAFIDELDTFDPRDLTSLLTTTALGEGNAGRIRLNAEQVSVQDGGQITTETQLGSSGNGNRLIVNASDTLRVLGVSAVDGIPSRVASSTAGTGRAGDLRLATRQFVILDGGEVSAATLAEDGGAGGRIQINADRVAISGSAIVDSERGGSSDRRPLARLPFRADDNESLTEIPSTLTASTSGGGTAGEILINSRRLKLQDGGTITTETLPGSRGDGNQITVLATETVQVLGVSSLDASPSGLFSSTEGDGNAGVLRLATDELRLENGGTISAATLSETAQSSGGLDLDVNRLIADNGTVSVETFAQGGSGADLNISGVDVLVLSNDSLLSAEAVNRANGGNIRLDASDGFVIAPVDTDSDILASANTGNGGEIEIVARNIFGLAERRAIPGNGTNDIDASSRFGASGTVSLNQLEVNPVPEAAELTERPETPEVSQACNPSQQISSLVLTGRGGIPPEPQTTVPGFLWHPSGEELAERTSVSIPQKDPSIMEAQGWQRNEAGQIVLSALHPTPNPHPPNPLPHCTLPS